MPRHRTKKIPTELITTTIKGLNHEGRGIAHIDGKTHFIMGALPGETVSFQLKATHSNYNEGETKTVITASPDRVAPRCPHFEMCGGCSLQHLAHDQQIQFKQNVVLEQMKHIGKLTPRTVLKPLIAEPWGYRHKARIGVRFVNKKDKLLIGFRERNGRYLADLSSCDVLDPRVGKNFVALREVIASLNCEKHIAQIEVAIGESVVALIIRHLIPLTPEDSQKLISFAQTYDFHIYLEPNKPLPLEKLWPKDGNDHLTYTLEKTGLRYQFKVTDFTQINPRINEQMINTAMDLLDPQPNDHILDLFCGMGNFTLPLATQAKHVIGIEGSQHMVDRAQANATLNQLQNTEFYSTDLFQDLPNTPWAKQHYDKILLDPPRSGAEHLAQNIAKLGAKKILYISCNPATLARDSAHLAAQGYTLDTLLIADMFAHTSHIETIAFFTLP